MGRDKVNRQMSPTALRGWIDSLDTTVKKLKWRSIDTAWADYYEDTNYTDQAGAHKESLVTAFLERVRAQSVWDMGANTGRYSRLASDRGISTVAFDVDPGAVEYNYLKARQAGETNLLPLLLDATNPSPGLGWRNQERRSILERGRPDCTLALALIHHLAIANNVPLPHLAEYFHSFSPWLIVEFVPKSDSQVERLLATRKDIFPDYTPAGFESAFQEYFEICASEAVVDSERLLYLMQARA